MDANLLITSTFTFALRQRWKKRLRSILQNTYLYRRAQYFFSLLLVLGGAQFCFAIHYQDLKFQVISYSRCLLLCASFMCRFIPFFYIEVDRTIYLLRTNHTPCRFSDSLCPYQAAIFKVGREGRRTYHAGHKFVCCLRTVCGRDQIVRMVDRPQGSLH